MRIKDGPALLKLGSNFKRDSSLKITPPIHKNMIDNKSATTIPHQTTDMSNEKDIVTPIIAPSDTITPSVSPSVSSSGSNDSNVQVPVLICFTGMICLIIIAVLIGYYYKRRFNERYRNSMLTTTTTDIRDSESNRSSGSSFLAIEVMTNTLSNLIKEQGGKIEIPSSTVPISSSKNISELVKVKSLKLSDETEYYPDKGENSFKDLVNNIFRKSYNDDV